MTQAVIFISVEFTHFELTINLDADIVAKGILIIVEISDVHGAMREDSDASAVAFVVLVDFSKVNISTTINDFNTGCIK